VGVVGERWCCGGRFVHHRVWLAVFVAVGQWRGAAVWSWRTTFYICHAALILWHRCRHVVVLTGISFVALAASSAACMRVGASWGVVCIPLHTWVVSFAGN